MEILPMDTQTMTNNKMTHIDNLIWKFLQYHINWNYVSQSKSKGARFIKPISKAKSVLEDINKLCKALPDSIGFYISYTGEYIFAPIETAQEIYAFNEIKASITGQLILEKQKEILALKQVWVNELKDLNEAKKSLSAILNTESL